MKLKILLPDSVPSNFPGLPQYYNKTIPDRRSESTSREARFQKQNDANEVEVEEFLAADKVSSLQELQEKMENDIPKGSEVKHKEAFNILVESLVQMTCIDFTNFLKLAEFTI